MSPKLSIEATTTHEITLAPQVKKKLKMNLEAYADLKVQRDAIDHAMKAHRDKVQGILDDVGETSLKLDGYTATVVTTTRKTLDQKKLIALGVTIDTIERATVETTAKPYVKVTVPGGGDE